MLFTPVGMFLGPGEYGGEFQEKKGAGCDGWRSSFLPHTCGLAQTEAKTSAGPKAVVFLR